MSSSKRRKPIDDHLEEVYGAETTEALDDAYAGWAEDYDTDVSSMGYRFPLLGAAVLARHLRNNEAAILDAGAGTGLVGGWLYDLGYTNLTALDLSLEMLEQARKLNVYKQLEAGDMLQRLPFADETFEAVIAVGVFTQGHVPPEGLDELLRVVISGGLIVIPLMQNSWENLGFEKKAVEWEQSGKWEGIDQTPWCRPMPNSADHKDDLGAVFAWRTT
jgi:SAM-dependent methyltransferase